MGGGGAIAQVVAKEGRIGERGDGTMLRLVMALLPINIMGFVFTTGVVRAVMRGVPVEATSGQVEVIVFCRKGAGNVCFKLLRSLIKSIKLDLIVTGRGGVVMRGCNERILFKLGRGFLAVVEAAVLADRNKTGEVVGSCLATSCGISTKAVKLYSSSQLSSNSLSRTSSISCQFLLQPAAVVTRPGDCGTDWGSGGDCWVPSEMSSSNTKSHSPIAFVIIIIDCIACWTSFVTVDSSQNRSETNGGGANTNSF